MKDVRTRKAARWREAPGSNRAGEGRWTAGIGNLAESPTFVAAMIIVALELQESRTAQAGRLVEPAQRRGVAVEIEDDAVADSFRGAAVIPVGHRCQMKVSNISRDVPGAGGQDRGQEHRGAVGKGGDGDDLGIGVGGFQSVRV